MATGEKLEIFRGDIISDENFFKMTTDLDRTIQVPSPTFIMPQTKNASGYFSKPSMDLIDLLIGSEGTLAAFSQIGIRLIPEIHIISGMSFFEDSDSAFDFADFLRQEARWFRSSILMRTLLALVSDNLTVCQRDFGLSDRQKSAVFWNSWKINGIFCVEI